MRFNLFCASALLAVGLVLSACSAMGGSQKIPGGSQFVVLGAPNDCPNPPYDACYEISKKTPVTYEVCVKDSGSNCPAPGKWTWKAEVEALKKDRDPNKVKVSFDPDPGNPTNVTIETTDLQPSHGKNVYAVHVQAKSGKKLKADFVYGISIDLK